MKTHLASSCLALFLMILSTQVFSAGLGWLGDAPIRYFSDKDSELMKNAVKNALSSNQDGVKLEWENTETGHKGSVTPLNRKEIKGLSCREAQYIIARVEERLLRNSPFVSMLTENGNWQTSRNLLHGFRS